MNFLKSIGPIVLLVAPLSGCAKLAHMQELLTLKAYSEEKDQQVELVRGQDERFQKLIQLAESKGLGPYTTQESFLKEFGAPVLKKSVVKEEQPLEEWLYRYSTEYFDSPKVYLYFDETGALQRWDYLPGKPKT